MKRSELKKILKPLIKECIREVILEESGVLSKIVGFGTKLYANISGESTNKDKDDIVVIDAIDNGLINYRTSWRENYFL